ncbi:MAG TPA: M28 family peptidase [Rectinemataceae bacterium]|nr:M28 family peptidase [Rectinemataceae bacterium]
MTFGPDAERFLALGSERLVALAGMLAARGLPYSVVRTGKERHLILRLGQGSPQLALAAHYDRYAGSPGMLDNSCACLQLVEFAARLASGQAPPLLFLFTDGEENPALQGPSGQGAFALARAVSRRLGPRSAMPPVLVLDVTGRGDTLLLSSAPAALLERNGMGGTALAEGHRRLRGLALAAAARARLGEPASLELPWSDDLGLVLGGIPALTVSLLPDAEARAYPAQSPRTWSYLHGPEDGPELAWDSSFALMAAFLDAVADAVRRGGRAPRRDPL